MVTRDIVVRTLTAFLLRRVAWLYAGLSLLLRGPVGWEARWRARYISVFGEPLLNRYCWTHPRAAPLSASGRSTFHGCTTQASRSWRNR